jgi:predicted RND superfamily exporter protein
MLEIIIILISALVLFLLYFARYISKDNNTFLFSETFLVKADDVIFDTIKFLFKIYTLLINNISAFFKTIPHTIVHFAHKISNALAGYTHTLVEKFKKIDNN